MSTVVIFELSDGTREKVWEDSPRHRELVADGHTPVGTVPPSDGISDQLQAYLEGQFLEYVQDVLGAPAEDPALAPFHTALANRHTSRVNVVHIGDSVVEGHPVPSFDRTIAQQLAARMRSRLPTSGLGARGGRGLITIPTQGPAPAIARPIVFANGAFDPAGVGQAEAFHVGPSRNAWYSPNPTGNAKLTTMAGATSVDVLHTKGTAGHVVGGYFKVGAAAKVPFGNVAGVPTLGVERATIGGGASTTLEVGVNVGGFYLILGGFVEYAGDEAKGIMVHNAGHSGYAAVDWSANPDTGGGWRDYLAALQPDLLVISLGPNDANAAGKNRSPSQFQADLAQLVAVLRDGGMSCPLAIEAKYDASGAMTFNQPWATYVDAMRELVDGEPHALLVDHSKVMAPAAAADPFGLYDTDRIHGNPTGAAHSVMADTLAAALLPT